MIAERVSVHSLGKSRTIVIPIRNKRGCPSDVILPGVADLADAESDRSAEYYIEYLEGHRLEYGLD